MNNIIEDNGEDQFANGQRSRSLRVNSGATEPQIQLDARPTGLEGVHHQVPEGLRLTTKEKNMGRLDIVFANAGVVKLAPVGTITEELYDSVFNINVKGVLFTVQKALPLLPDGASIILNASIGASKGPP